MRHDPHSWEGVDRGLFDVLRALRALRAADARHREHRLLVLAGKGGRDQADRSGNVAEIHAVWRGDVKRAKLFYLRKKTGKAAKINEKKVTESMAT